MYSTRTGAYGSEAKKTEVPWTALMEATREENGQAVVRQRLGQRRQEQTRRASSRRISGVTQRHHLTSRRSLYRLQILSLVNRRTLADPELTKPPRDQMMDVLATTRRSRSWLKHQADQ